MQRHIEKAKLKKLEENLELELKKTPRNRQVIKNLRGAIAIIKDMLGE